MKKFIPKEKLGKKARKQLDSEQRTTWTFSPVTKKEMCIRDSIHTMPGDPIIYLIGEEEYYYLLDNDPAFLEQQIEKYGLNDSLPVQYARYLKSIVTLDFGESYSNHRPVRCV